MKQTQDVPGFKIRFFIGPKANTVKGMDFPTGLFVSTSGASRHLFMYGTGAGEPLYSYISKPKAGTLYFLCAFD